MPTDNDRIFGEIAVRRGFLSSEEIAEAMSRLENLERAGCVSTLDRVLLEGRLLGPDQVSQICAAQGRLIQFCSGCGTKYNVSGLAPGARFECQVCKTSLVVPYPGNLVAESPANRRRPVSEVTFRPRDPAATRKPGSGSGSDPALRTQVPNVGEGDLSGRELGNYRVLELLGKGSYGAVYEAVHSLLERRVALKVLWPALLSDEKYVKRFLREGRATARLAHPNVVGIHDMGQEGLHYYIAMELVDGEPLDTILVRKGKLQPHHALEIVAQLCSGLEVAHAAGIVHRDIKPANLLITRAGTVKLTDLGLAKRLGELDRLTQTGSCLGTPAYMSPEQVEAASDIDGRTDLWSAGVLLFQMLTGRKPFESKSVMQMFSMIAAEPVVAPSALEPSLPAAVDRLVLHLLAKDRGKRPQTAAEVVDQVNRLLGRNR